MVRTMEPRISIVIRASDSVNSLIPPNLHGVSPGLCGAYNALRDYYATPVVVHISLAGQRAGLGIGSSRPPPARHIRATGSRARRVGTARTDRARPYSTGDYS